jgi:beta-glucosidase
VWEQENAQQLADSSEQRYSHWLPAWPEIKTLAQDPSNYISGAGVEHYGRYDDDFALAQSLSLNALRTSFEWSRIEPAEGHWNQAAIDHYRSYLISMKQHGLEPIMTLWHWTVPQWFAERGGFARRSNVKYFVRFAQKIIDEFGDELSCLLTVNEPNVYAGHGYVKAIWPPQKRNLWLYFRVMSNLAFAHKQIYEHTKRVRPDLLIGSAYQLTFRSGDDWLGKCSAQLADYVWNYWWLDRTKMQHDFIGINFYFTGRYRAFFAIEQGEPRSDYGWHMAPEKLEQALQAVYGRYGRPVMITENGLADAQDHHRQWWFEQTFAAIEKAVKGGVEIVGYMHWSLLDNFEWADGYWPRFGLIEVDRTTMKRHVRSSAGYYARRIKQATMN